MIRGRGIFCGRNCQAVCSCSMKTGGCETPDFLQAFCQVPLQNVIYAMEMR